MYNSFTQHAVIFYPFGTVVTVCHLSPTVTK